VVSLGRSRVYNVGMPLDPISSAIINAIIGSAVQQITSLPPSSVPVPNVAVPRMLPQGTLQGMLSVFSPTSAEIDGKAVTMSPGVQIRDPFNMMVLPGMIRQPVLVRYQTDVAGYISRIWILSVQEAAQP
jgi:hypothetical protein